MNKDLTTLSDAIYASGYQQLETLTYNRARAASVAGALAAIVVEGIAKNPEAAQALARLVRTRREDLEQ